MADQKVTVTATGSDAKISLTKTSVPNGDTTVPALGGLGDIGKGGWAAQTFKFDKPVWAFGVTYFSPNDVNLSKSDDVPVSYTLSDVTVVRLGSAGASGGVISGNNRTFVGVVDQSGKGHCVGDAARAGHGQRKPAGLHRGHRLRHAGSAARPVEDDAG